MSVSISIVAAVNDDEVLLRNLLRSPLIEGGRAEVLLFRNCSSASIAYNAGLDTASGDIVVFVHQDVYIPRNWEAHLNSAIEKLQVIDPNWAVLGAFGIGKTGKRIGRVWSSGLCQYLGQPLVEPAPAVTIDELMIIVRQGSRIRFDEGLPSFHLYGTDIIQIAAAFGLRSYVGDLPVVHNSRPVRSLRGGFALSYRYMRQKWKAQLPLQTLTVPIERYQYRLLKQQAAVFLSRKSRMRRARPATTDPKLIAKELFLE